MYPILMVNLKRRELYCYSELFCTNYKACKFYLVPHIMIWVAWKQSYSCFSEQIDFQAQKFYVFWNLCALYQSVVNPIH